MSVKYNPSIVTGDDLVLHLDAANTRSYPGSGTTWTDLSGNGNNGTLLDGASYSTDNRGVLVFSAINQRVTVADNSTLDIAGDKTLSCWVRMGADSAGCAIAGKMNNTDRGMGIAYGWNGNGFSATTWNSNNAPFIAKNFSRDILKWVFVTAIQSANNRMVYVFDEIGFRESSSINAGIHTWNNSAPFAIRTTSDNGSRAPDGTRIAQVYVYNRVLTLAEVEKNFNATRGRFGV